MDTFVRFLFEFMSVFFSGVGMIFKGLFGGILQMFNISEYLYTIEFYRKDFNMSEWVLVVIAVIVMLIVLLLIILLIWFVIRKYVKFRKTLVEQESMLEEIGSLNKQVADLVQEKEKILAMKVSQLGLKPTEEAVITNEEENSENQGSEETENLDNIRFSKLHAIDVEYMNYKIQNYNNTFTLEELVELFRNFAASKLKLYYTSNMIRLFISGLSATKLVILQGISGTGKTSLAYAWGKFIRNDAIIASVQPSWRDRTELFGYFNEFTKKFNETEVLKEMYMAGYTNDIYTIILDEMNISRVEYYFAEMLSILEMPNKDEWIVELVPNSWKSDPKKLKGGKLQIPPNLWYIGTINNDDSTFMVTDKVYDRAMPIDINDKGQPFDPIDTDPMDVNYTYLDQLFAKAMIDNAVSKDTLDKIEIMDNYVIQHFRIAFGNRIVAQMKKFVPVFVGCGGDEIEGVDYFLARKVLRKFEQLNISYIRDEIDPYIDFLNKTFGKDKMKECIEYLTRLKKLT